ncbi:RNA-directed DNA polymerase, eukaryota, Reverse transcriptase zinc-binding domain protein [Artemisia annua]|uniref:RNA-directed DNA polymerase, eukaryota, Reverse transcriptase zinc-binding domain protein n=1 Tax=Artemisia annua TaxID=35608 RepID=A0A2U1PWZ3_ARTAN|nr:RNA-directed DNA polymerase, eukaryota, Reverse transcriptase zinc-binding domain protein [Artemisia annua]
MIKWIWRFYSQKASLWTRVIKAIHGDDGKLVGDTNMGVQTCWTTIVKEVKRLKEKGINVEDLNHVKLGNGETMLFWEDKWYSGGRLRDLFPRLYALEMTKTATVRMKLMGPSLHNTFRRNIRGGAEEAQLTSLLDIIGYREFSITLERPMISIFLRH